MKLRNKLFAGLALFTLLLAGCNSDGSSSGEESDPPVIEKPIPSLGKTGTAAFWKPILTWRMAQPRPMTG